MTGTRNLRPDLQHTIVVINRKEASVMKTVRPVQRSLCHLCEYHGHAAADLNVGHEVYVCW